MSQNLAKQHKRWGGYSGGSGFKFDSTEKSQQQKARAAEKRKAGIGKHNEDEEPEFLSGLDASSQGGLKDHADGGGGNTDGY